MKNKFLTCEVVLIPKFAGSERGMDISYEIIDICNSVLQLGKLHEKLY